MAPDESVSTTRAEGFANPALWLRSLTTVAALVAVALLSSLDAK